MIKIQTVVNPNIIVVKIYSCGIIIENQSLKIKQHPVKITINVNNKTLLNTLKGIDIFINNENPVSTVKNTQIVE